MWLNVGQELSFDFNVAYSSRWGYSLIKTLKLKKNEIITFNLQLFSYSYLHVTWQRTRHYGGRRKPHSRCGLSAVAFVRLSLLCACTCVPALMSITCGSCRIPWTHKNKRIPWTCKHTVWMLIIGLPGRQKWLVGINVSKCKHIWYAMHCKPLPFF